MSAMSAANPEHLVNLAYFIGSNHAPHAAIRINVLGTDKTPCAVSSAFFRRVDSLGFLGLGIMRLLSRRGAGAKAG